MKNKKLINIIFIVIFSLIIFIPLVNTNFKDNVISYLDNRKLEPNPKSIKELRLNGEAYLTDRIGFRDDMLVLYNTMLDKGFNVLENPLFMYGDDGHVFFAYDAYIKSYQGLNNNDAILDRNVNAVKAMQEYVEGQGKDFLYVLVSDKKTVYSEYFPKTINVIKKPSLADSFIEELNKLNVNNLYFADLLIEAKSTAPTYNKLFDAGHWNAYGAWLGHSKIFEYFNKNFDRNIPLLNLNDYNVTSHNVDLVHYITIHKNEQVPQYNLKTKNYTKNKIKELYFTTQNENAPINKTLLIMGDSYFINSDTYHPYNACEEYYSNTFKKVIYTQNITGAEIASYFEQYNPDIVIYETAERVIDLSGVLNWQTPIK